MIEKENKCDHAISISVPLLQSSERLPTDTNCLWPLRYICLSSTILIPLPWLIRTSIDHYGMRCIGDVCLHTFPLQFILTIKMISKLDSWVMSGNNITRLFILSQISNLLMIAYQAIDITALIASQMLCWLLLLDVRLIDSSCFSHFILIGYIYGSLFYTAAAVDDLNYIVEKSTIISYTMGVGLVMKMTYGCAFWRHSNAGFLNASSILSWLTLVLNWCLLLVFIVAYNILDKD
jgi:hypothetical protein